MCLNVYHGTVSAAQTKPQAFARQSVIGRVLIGLGILLAQGLGMSLAELHEAARGLRRSERGLYHLPAIGIGVLLYGLLIWSRACSEQRE